MKKNTLIASFIYKDRIDWFNEYLMVNYNIQKSQIYVFETNDEYRYMVTFKLVSNVGVKIDFKSAFPNATIVHKKKNTIYSINALNKLIEETSEVSLGNIDYKSIKIDWLKYENKLILMRNDELVISDIKRIF